MASHVTPSPLSHPPLTHPIPLISSDTLGDLHCKLLFSPSHFRSRLLFLLFFPSSIQPASERGQPALQDRFHHHQASARRRRYPKDPSQYPRRVVLTSLSRSSTASGLAFFFFFSFFFFSRSSFLPSTGIGVAFSPFTLKTAPGYVSPQFSSSSGDPTEYPGDATKFPG